MSKEFKVGLITIIAGALLYYGFNFLRGSNLFSPTDRYYVIYPNVAGLTVSNPIYLNGLPVGKVSDFKILQGLNNIIVALDIDRNLKITDGTFAQLANDGLLGTKAIILVLGDTTRLLQPGDTLKSETDDGIFDKFDPAIDNINTTITKLNDVLDKLIETDIKGMVDTLKYSIGLLTYKANRIDIESIINNSNELITSLNDKSDEIETLLKNSNSLIDTLKAIPLSKTLENLNTSLNQINNLMLLIESDSGTVGKMLKNDSIYNNLNKTLVDLDNLIIHFNTYPKDFLTPLGRKKKKLKGVIDNEK